MTISSYLIKFVFFIDESTCFQATSIIEQFDSGKAKFFDTRQTNHIIITFATRWYQKNNEQMNEFFRLQYSICMNQPEYRFSFVFIITLNEYVRRECLQIIYHLIIFLEKRNNIVTQRLTGNSK